LVSHTDAEMQGAMPSGLPQFTNDQWGFLAVLEALGEPVPIEVAGTLAPLMPGPLFDLLNRAEGLGLIRKTDADVFCLVSQLPPDTRTRLKKINTPERLDLLVERLEQADLLPRLEPSMAARFFARAGRLEEAGRIEEALAREALQNRDYDTAMERFKKAALRYHAVKGSRESDAACVASTLELSHVSFALGKGFTEVPPFLEKAKACVDRLGDRRSRALLDLHLGRYFYFADRRAEALKTLRSGQLVVEELGDDDILSQSAEFLGLLFFMQGHFREAWEHFERASVSIETREERLRNPLAPVFMSFCAAFLGRYHEAIGILDNHWRNAQRDGPKGLATNFRSLLGNVLLMVRKKRDALVHLYGALQDAAGSSNALGLYWAKGGLAYHHFMEGRLREARDTFAQAMEESAHAGIVRQYGSPWILEMLFEIDRLGYEGIPAFSYRSEVQRILTEPNIHLRGVVLRLQAREGITTGEAPDRILTYLQESKTCLTASGDPVQLAKTLLEMARLELGKGERQRARELAQKAWQGLSGYADEFFPDDLRYLLATPERDHVAEGPEAPESVLQRFLEMMEDFIPSPDLNEILRRAVAATNHFLGAERGALLWFHGGRPDKAPALRAGINLTEKEIASEAFRSSLALVFKSFREQRPLLVRPKTSGPGRTGQPVLSILCLPVEVGGKLRGVLYHDNAYLDDCFDFLDGPLLVRLFQHVSLFIDRIWAYGRLLEEKTREATEKAVQTKPFDEDAILAQSRSMTKLLAQADRIAESGAIVLLLGETGVGKELMARRIHRKSLRNNAPYVIVDTPTIPEALLESELFGHEKGAFTGADRQKSGRIELADRGTLFLDEVGELPLSIQGKLLRVLEQKTFSRIGSNRVLHSDFRLVAATNRNLAEEVARGRFREDLYYRLNVVPLEIPPLRERDRDVVLLARHFLALYAKRFNRPHLVLTPSEEEELTAYDWPGNVRELRNVMERAVLLSSGERLALNLPVDPRSEANHSFEDCPTMDNLQRRYIQYVLERTGNRISGSGGAAEVLGMDRATLYHRMKKLGLR
jgi:transcriptional regulator with GAF, ATPase, and Fis domain